MYNALHGFSVCEYHTSVDSYHWVVVNLYSIGMQNDFSISDWFIVLRYISIVRHKVMLWLDRPVEGFVHG